LFCAQINKKFKQDGFAIPVNNLNPNTKKWGTATCFLYFDVLLKRLPTLVLIFLGWRNTCFNGDFGLVQ
jgi:hypothetical protein